MRYRASLICLLVLIHLVVFDNEMLLIMRNLTTNKSPIECGIR